MKRHIIIGALAIATLAGGVPGVHAQPGPDFDGAPLGEGYGRHGKMDPEQHLARMAKKLKLTDAQKEQVQAIIKAEKERIAPLREKLTENRKKLREATEAETFDEAAVKALAATQAELQAELMVSHVKTRQQVHAILTPEQRELAKKLHPMKGEKGEKGRRRHRKTE